MSTERPLTPSPPPWDSPVVWGWATSHEAESWKGQFATREEAIADAVSELGQDEEIYVRSGHVPDPAACLPACFVEDLLDRVCENGAEWGDVAEDWPDPVEREAKEELEAYVKEWLRRHCAPAFWLAYGVLERVKREEKRW